MSHKRGLRAGRWRSWKGEDPPGSGSGKGSWWRQHLSLGLTKGNHHRFTEERRTAWEVGSHVGYAYVSSSALSPGGFRVEIKAVPILRSASWTDLRGCDHIPALGGLGMGVLSRAVYPTLWVFFLIRGCKIFFLKSKFSVSTYKLLFTWG